MGNYQMQNISNSEKEYFYVIYKCTAFAYILHCDRWCFTYFNFRKRKSFEIISNDYGTPPLFVKAWVPEKVSL